ncbi:hypothetical protein KAW50_08605 [candidate division WOR-3 bacterium]|nr:hypothetical protein [candidate division WOR-3 bacterium]
MKSGIILTAILVVVSANLSYAEVESELHFSPFWDFYSDNRFSTIASGKGCTGIAGANDISGAVLNPASLEIDKRCQFHFEYVYKSKVEWLEEVLDDVYLKQLHPTVLAGLGFHFNDYLQAGILYYTNNNYKLDLGAVTVIDEIGHEIGRSFCYNKFKITSFSLPVVLCCKDIIRFGVNISYSHYSLEEVLVGEWYEGKECVGKANFYKIVPKFGAIIFPLKNLSLGLTFLPETKETIVKEWSSDRNRWLKLKEPIKREWFNPLDENFQPNVLPLKIGIGLQYKLDKIPIHFSLDYNYSNNSKDELLMDRNDIHFGLEYDINNHLTLRTGFFKQQDYRNRTLEWCNKLGDYGQIFITFGTSFKVEYFVLNFSVMDSHLFSTGEIEQTYINTGATCSF